MRTYCWLVCKGLANYNLGAISVSGLFSWGQPAKNDFNIFLRVATKKKKNMQQKLYMENKA